VDVNGGVCVYFYGEKIEGGAGACGYFGRDIGGHVRVCAFLWEYGWRVVCVSTVNADTVCVCVSLGTYIEVCACVDF
jgi:hypothetical protein